MTDNTLEQIVLNAVVDELIRMRDAMDAKANTTNNTTEFGGGKQDGLICAGSLLHRRARELSGKLL